MPLKIVRNDITKMKVDAIVNAANNSLLGGGGVDGAIHRAAGKGLLAECRTLGGCETGKAKITGGYFLPAKYVIHTVGPVWNGGGHGEKQLLISAYRSSLELGHENGCESMAFPLISAGVYGYPKNEAFRVAVDTITEFLSDHDMTVYMVIFDRASFIIGEKLFSDISSFIDDNYVNENFIARSALQRKRLEFRAEQSMPVCASFAAMPDLREASAEECCAYDTLDEAVSSIDESFSEMLIRKIDEKGITDPQCYKKANVDRKLFSKIKNDRLYKPSKATAIAFAIALELPLDETKDMLMKAGFALSHSDKFDIIIEYFISRKNYNIFEINEALFAFDQNILGA